MCYINLVYAREMQESWVLLSGSADQSEFAKSDKLHSIHKDIKLTEARSLNKLNASDLIQSHKIPNYNRKKYRPAIIITGHLRCFAKSRLLFNKLGENCDIYIATTGQYRREALSITSKTRISIIEDDDEARSIDSSLPFNTMKQWHKLAIGLKLIEAEERKAKKRYTHLLKVRSDYFFVHPENIIRDLRVSSNTSLGLVGASDKVFGGRRDHMMLMKDFFNGLLGWHIRTNNVYWPINLEQVLASDESIKWYGFNWPIELIGTPATVDNFKTTLKVNYYSLRQKLQAFRPTSETKYHNLFQGNINFASEIAFARHLNFVGIPFNECFGLRGFLYQNRR